MLIGELSKQVGLSKDTIRFYEKMGLIVADERQAGTRVYKEFRSETVELLKMITQGKSLGFTLNEMLSLIQTWGSKDMPTEEKLRVIDRKLSEISNKMRQLDDIKIALTEKRCKIVQEEIQNTQKP
jgi:MerR family transcriptional regulator, copper efflux regulator